MKQLSQPSEPLKIERSAKFSDCGNYRFWLSRNWDAWNEDAAPQLMLIGLNPSRADAEKDDPTIRRICSLAKNMGYSGIVMTNLFPFITPYPAELKKDIHLYHMEFNDECLKANARVCEDVCFCWGNFSFPERIAQVVEMFPNAFCFGKNKNGSPKHPLYLKSDTELVKF